MNNPDSVEVGQLWLDVQENIIYLILERATEVHHTKGSYFWVILSLSDCPKYDWFANKAYYVQDSAILKDRYCGIG